MAQLSAAQSGKPIALLLDGKVIWAPIVRGAVEKDAVLTALTPAQIDRLLSSFKGLVINHTGAPPTPTRPELSERVSRCGGSGPEPLIV